MGQARPRSQPPGPLTPAAKMAKGPHGNPLCRWCSKETASKRRTFCSQACVDEWRLRSDPAFLRAFILKRDGRRCANCCRTDVGDVKAISLRYEVDHIQPLAEGGSNDPTNLRVLCRPCHAKETGALRRRLNEAQRPEREAAKAQREEWRRQRAERRWAAGVEGWGAGGA